MAHSCVAATASPGRLAWEIFAPPLTASDVEEIQGLFAFHSNVYEHDMGVVWQAVVIGVDDSLEHMGGGAN